MYLNEILRRKREEVRDLAPPTERRLRPILDPIAHLRSKPFIAEIKKASPSRGIISADCDIAGRARAYERGGAGAVSVVTDRHFFQGDFRYLQEACAHVSLPLLCKDFIISEVQIDCAYCHGADLILLIVDILNVRELRILAKRARRYGMNILFEIRSADHLQLLNSLNPEIVGVNARDLNTFVIERERSLAVIASLPRDFLIVAESGIETPRDIEDYRRAGADAFLIGTALMTADDPEYLLREFNRTLAGLCS